MPTLLWSLDRYIGYALRVSFHYSSVGFTESSDMPVKVNVFRGICLQNS